MSPDELEAKLEAITRVTFETGALGMQNAIGKWLLKHDLVDVAQSIMRLPLPPYMPPPKGSA